MQLICHQNHKYMLSVVNENEWHIALSLFRLLLLNKSIPPLVPTANWYFFRVSFIIGDIQYATHLAAILYMHSPTQIGRKPLQLLFLSIPLGTRAILEALLSIERISSESLPLGSLLIRGVKKLFLLS